MLITPSSTLKKANDLSNQYPVPYGIIPKRKKQTEPKIIFSSEKQQDTACSATHIRDHLTIASYFISVFQTYFGNSNHVSYANNNTTTNNKNKLYINRKGLLPHTPTRKTADTYITPQTVTAPITMAGVGDTDDQDDNWDYLSKSDSSTSSAGSSFSSISSLSSINSTRQRRSVSSLSEILCDHYVQKTLHGCSSSSTSTNNNDEMMDVPLETYKVFEASRRRSSSGSSTTNEDSNNIDYEDERQDKEEQEEEEEEEEDESWFIWDNLQKTKEWIQVVDEELFLPKEKVTTEITMAVEQQQPPAEQKNVRGIRANPAHLRMIVAEVNMMRCNKIVGPLKPRGFLHARKDTFVPNTSSPLAKLPISAW